MHVLYNIKHQRMFYTSNSPKICVNSSGRPEILSFSTGLKHVNVSLCAVSRRENQRSGHSGDPPQSQTLPGNGQHPGDEVWCCIAQDTDYKTKGFHLTKGVWVFFCTTAPNINKDECVLRWSWCGGTMWLTAAGRPSSPTRTPSRTS